MVATPPINSVIKDDNAATVESNAPVTHTLQNGLGTAICPYCGIEFKRNTITHKFCITTHRLAYHAALKANAPVTHQ